MLWSWSELVSVEIFRRLCLLTGTMATYSIQSLDFDKVMDLANAVYFDPKIRIGKNFSKERQWLVAAGNIYCQVFSVRGKQRDHTVKRAIDLYGPKVIAKRILALILEDRYLHGRLAYYHPHIARTFCEFKDIVNTVASFHGHVSLVKRAWEVIKERKGLMDSEVLYNFSPRNCVNVLCV